MKRFLVVIELLVVLLLVQVPIRSQIARAPGTPKLLFDRTHESPSAVHYMEMIFGRGGVSVVRNDASLVTVADELSTSQALLIWQESTSVPFTPEEVTLIRNYVNRGGRLVLVGNAADWSRRNKSAPVAAYPLFRLASALGVKLGQADKQKDVGKGRLVYLHRRTLLSYATLQAEALNAPGPASRRLLGAFPKSRPAALPVGSVIAPEKSFTVGLVQVRYPENLSVAVKPVKELLRRLLPVLAKTYDCPLETQITVTALPFTGFQWTSSPDFSLNINAPPDRIAYDLGRSLAYRWYFPGGRKVSLPRWISQGWIHAAAIRALKSIGFAAQADDLSKVYRSAFLAADPKMNQMDLIVNPPARLANAYRGKAITLLESLEKKTGRNVQARLRKAIRVAHAAGEFERKLDANQTVRLLSLGLGADQFGHFLQMGVTVTPSPLDFAHFRQNEQELDRLLATK